MTSAEIITIGTELLLGETLDTNTRTISRAFRTEGIDLFRSQVIGDNVQRIAALIREALARADIVLTTGGLGPTVDDPTRAAAASAAGYFLEFHPELWDQIRDRIARFGRTPSENQKTQAFLPQFAIPIPNPVGTAPAFIVEIGARSLICLPGVPREMETLLEQAVIPYLRKRFSLDEQISIRTLHVSGMGEGMVDEQIADLERLSNPTVGLSAHPGIVSIRITAKSKSPSASSEMIATIEADVRKRLGANIFGADSDTLEAITLQALSSEKLTLSTLEFQTSNTLRSRLEKVANPIFLGGREQQVGPATILDELENTRHHFASAVCLGLSCQSIEGHHKALIGILAPTGTQVKELSYGGHPLNFHTWAVNVALDLLRRTIET